MSILTSERPPTIAIWTWLPGERTPVPAGLLASRAGVFMFTYGRRYLERPGAISLYGPELPLQTGWIAPPDGLSMPSCLRDGMPDGWGQRVINARLGDSDAEFGPETYMLESGTDRFGAIDFQRSPEQWIPRSPNGTLDELHDAAQRFAEGMHLSPHLESALIHGTSIGGARPKAVLTDGDQHWLAKFSVASDPLPVVKAEALAMGLARRCGVRIPTVNLIRSLGRDVLLVERFDRISGGGRLHVVSGLTLVGLDESLGRYATYPDMLEILQSHGGCARIGQELFTRIAVNIAVSNNVDHARNHAAFWDGQTLRLTPAFDIAPGPMTTISEMNQAMAYGIDGQRRSNLAALTSAHAIYGMSLKEAHAEIDRVVTIIADSFDEAADEARLGNAERRIMWGRQILPEPILRDWPTPSGSKR